MWMKIVQSSILNTGSNWNFPQLTPRQERHPTAARRSESRILVALELVTTRRQGKKFPSENWRLEVDSQVWEVMAKKFVAVLDLNCPVWTNSHRTFCFCIKGSICLQSMSQHVFFKPIFLIVFISCNIPVSWLNQSGSSSTCWKLLKGPGGMERFTGVIPATLARGKRRMQGGSGWWEIYMTWD